MVVVGMLLQRCCGLVFPLIHACVFFLLGCAHSTLHTPSPLFFPARFPPPRHSRAHARTSDQTRQSLIDAMGKGQKVREEKAKTGDGQ